MQIDANQTEGSAAIALFVLIAAAALWIALRAFLRSFRASKTQAAVKGDFIAYTLNALVNAAKIDGRVNEEEKSAIVAAMREIGGAAFQPARVEEAFAHASLNKNNLVAYLAAHSRDFSRDQKVALLKALLSVFVSDGRFDESEHAALVDYTEAVGFDRKSAPDTLRGIAQGFMRGSIT